MAATELVLNGKKYVSSARAAQLVGYTKDYVGQLARAGKIESQLIGRSWYVSEDSIQKHKVSVHYTLKNPKKPRKDTARSDEKTNADKDSSEVTLHRVDEDRTRNDSTSDSVPERSDQDEPLSLRYENDVLVRSDIVYESEPPLMYDTDDRTEEVPESVEELADPEERAIRSIPIRLPTKPARGRMRDERHAGQTQQASRGLDGVALQRRPPVRRRRPSNRDLCEHPLYNDAGDGAEIRRTSSPSQQFVPAQRGAERLETVPRRASLRESFPEDVRRRPRASRTVRDDSMQYQDDLYQEEDQRFDARRPKRGGRSSSKVVPVLGALVFLAACTLAYLLFVR